MKQLKSYKQQLLNIAFILLIILIPTVIFAQPGFDDDVSDVPVDGGLSLLVAAGIGYGAKKMRDKRQK